MLSAKNNEHFAMDDVLLFTSCFFLQCFKPQLDSFKIVCDLYLVYAINLHYCHSIKIFFIEKTIEKNMCAP